MYGKSNIDERKQPLQQSKQDLSHANLNPVMSVSSIAQGWCDNYTASAGGCIKPSAYRALGSGNEARSRGLAAKSSEKLTPSTRSLPSMNLYAISSTKFHNIFLRHVTKK